MARKFSVPMASIVERPIAESIEYRPPTQSQNSNMLAVSMPNLATSEALVETATKCLATDFFVAAETRDGPRAGRVGVGHGLQGGERFRRYDEQRFRRIEITNGFRKVGAVNVGDEPEGHGPFAVMPERLVGHHGAEIRASDADIDHVANAFARVALPRAAAHSSGEIGHFFEDGVHLGHHVLSVYEDGCALWRAQRHVQNRTFLRDVDLLPVEHGIDPFAQAGFFREFKEKPQRFVGDAIL